MREIPPHEYVQLRGSSIGLLDPNSLEERIRRAEHDAGKPIDGRFGMRSHCWLCRRHHENEESQP